MYLLPSGGFCWSSIATGSFLFSDIILVLSGSGPFLVPLVCLAAASMLKAWSLVIYCLIHSVVTPVVGSNNIVSDPGSQWSQAVEAALGGVIDHLCVIL